MLMVFATNTHTKKNPNTNHVLCDKPHAWSIATIELLQGWEIYLDYR